MGLFKRFSVTFEFQRPSVAGTRHFDTNGTPTQSPKSFTSTRDFNHPSLRHRTSTIRHFDTELRSSVTSTRIFVDVTNCWKDVSKWRMIEVTCRSHGWLKWRVEVKDFGTWVGVAFFWITGTPLELKYCKIFVSIIKKSRYGYLSIYAQKTQVCPNNFCNQRPEVIIKHLGIRSKFLTSPKSSKGHLRSP